MCLALDNWRLEVSLDPPYDSDCELREARLDYRTVSTEPSMIQAGDICVHLTMQGERELRVRHTCRISTAPVP